MDKSFLVLFFKRELLTFLLKKPAHNAESQKMAKTNLPALEFNDLVRLKQRAARHGRPLESEVCAIIQDALSNDQQPGFDELAAELRALTAGRAHTPAEELMHECRVEG